VPVFPGIFEGYAFGQVVVIIVLLGIDLGRTGFALRFA
jgi:hypothetical protein